MFGRFPSFDYLLKKGAATFARFPFTLIAGITATVAAIILVHTEGGAENNYLEKLMLACTLGLPLFTALVCFAEKIGWNKQKTLLIQLGGLVFLAAYYFSLPPDIDDPLYHLQRYVLLNIAFHFAVAFLPYLGGKQVQGFWQYNKSLFLRFLLAALYSAVMYFGLVLALAALDYLFGVDIDEKSYFELWLVMAGVLNTWIFLAGIPGELEKLNDVSDYPKGLNIFTQYILLPLVGLYFIILISYEAKIIITWNWPKGWVSQMVLWYAVVGILSLLLLHPLREKSESKWIQVFSRWFFRALVPLVAMLFLAILVRISDYGITENRYYVLAMAVGLAIVVLYFVFSRVKDIRIIPIVICAIALLSSFGPWSAFSVSKSSQSNRFEMYLTNNQMLTDGAIQKASAQLPLEDEREMSSIINYLNETHGLAAFSRWFDDSTLNSLDTVNRYSRPTEIAKLLGIEYMPHYRGADDQQYFDFTPKEREIINLEGFDYLVDLGSYNVGAVDQKFPVGQDSVHVLYDVETYTFKFILMAGRDSTKFETVEYSLADAARKLIAAHRTGNVPQNELMFNIDGQKFDARIVVKQISGYELKEEIIVNLLSADILLRLN